MAKPFLKWAGGKTQLLLNIEKSLPYDFNKTKFTYVEPFLGSGAVLFWMLKTFPKLDTAIVNDINKELINTYKIIAKQPRELISVLLELQNEYHELAESTDLKKEYYYSKREKFNLKKSNSVDEAALFIFLNRTCFNGLYRVNRKNYFNVPIGSYQKPTICDTDNLMSVSNALQRVQLLHGDYQETLNYVNTDSFFYFDPPYKPLSDTSSFTSYTENEFNDNEQIRLKNFCTKLNNIGHFWMLSNSDVKGKDPDNNFFDDLYSDFQITRVSAKRTINANPDKRGKLNELLITNYATEQALQTA